VLERDFLQDFQVQVQSALQQKFGSPVELTQERRKTTIGGRDR
jgi:hypothetical protein